ncbi:hypothetical protein ABTX15_19335 [Micromonospora sp. NPDC094482]|uniref:hypothetical protein n=1 Tax=unclassified Micromonospora TaxID=2617518 RepID=UPI00332C4D10
MTAAVISGSAPNGPTFAPQGPVRAGSVEVLDLNGLRNVAFGDTEAELTRRGVLRSDVDACGPLLTGHETVSPVFVDDRLVLLWAGDPMQTPEGVTVGTPVTEVWSRYPSVITLHAPRGTYRFDGLLARRGDRGYLFLHDGQRVRNVIAGYAEWARQLFVEGAGPC